MGDNQQPQPQPCQGHVVKCARCRRNPGIEPGYQTTACKTCNGSGHVLLK